MTVAVLALQGAFAEHTAALERLGAEYFEARQARDLERPFDGLILPGGESTTMRKLLLELELFYPLRDRIASGTPVFGTCAGLILLAKEVSGGAPCFGTMDVAVKRNAYGRQLGSFHTEAFCEEIGVAPMTFIRAPYIESVWGDARVLAVVDGKIVAARQGNQLATAFHPELCDDLAVHRYFLRMIAENNEAAGSVRDGADSL